MIGSVVRGAVGSAVGPAVQAGGASAIDVRIESYLSFGEYDPEGTLPHFDNRGREYANVNGIETRAGSVGLGLVGSDSGYLRHDLATPIDYSGKHLYAFVYAELGSDSSAAIALAAAGQRRFCWVQTVGTNDILCLWEDQGPVQYFANLVDAVDTPIRIVMHVTPDGYVEARGTGGEWVEVVAEAADLEPIVAIWIGSALTSTRLEEGDIVDEPFVVTTTGEMDESVILAGLELDCDHASFVAACQAEGYSVDAGTPVPESNPSAEIYSWLPMTDTDILFNDDQTDEQGNVWVASGGVEGNGTTCDFDGSDAQLSLDGLPVSLESSHVYMGIWLSPDDISNIPKAIDISGSTALFVEDDRHFIGDLDASGTSNVSVPALGDSLRIVHYSDTDGTPPQMRDTGDSGWTNGGGWAPGDYITADWPATLDLRISGVGTRDYNGQARDFFLFKTGPHKIPEAVASDLDDETTSGTAALKAALEAYGFSVEDNI